jgi:hypothetical protein
MFSENSLAWARPGHPSLDPATMAVWKTWMAGSTPATGFSLVVNDRGFATSFAEGLPDSKVRSFTRCSPGECDRYMVNY